MNQQELNAERRDREIERTGGRRMILPFHTKVVGVSFVDSYPDNLYALDMAQREAQRSGEPLTVVLVRNPENRYDANAIEVHVPALGEEWAMMGHLTRPIAARLAPAIDAGDRWQAAVESVLIDPDHPENPGISIYCAPVREEEEHGT